MIRAVVPRGARGFNLAARRGPRSLEIDPGHRGQYLRAREAGLKSAHWQQTVRSPTSTRLPVGVESLVVWQLAPPMSDVYLKDL